MSEAKATYGEGLYKKTIYELNKEFTEEVFPMWYVMLKGCVK